MDPHISCAMRNAEAVDALVFVNAPSGLLDWSFLATVFVSQPVAITNEQHVR
jgi:hypothetical protein